LGVKYVEIWKGDESFVKRRRRRKGRRREHEGLHLIE
jgi:hypothetical protein